MADVTGALHHDFRGKSYTLRMTMRGLAQMQEKHGNDLGGLLSEGGDKSAVPPLAPALDLISIALQRGEGLDAEEADNLADEMMTADRNLGGRVLAAAFPDVKAAQEAAPGNARTPATKRKPR
ncbi:hypothetical protein M3484_01970 [Pseudomonas sp. GX19020]|uniref:hypothetical protein n=1 Tax=Pseudomonas sp. GX19020 TaxID=2942277 RepID=UPI002019B54D|nr:hypothetical protein [Pseudomonas sp. GX19020]MCL4065343.1 hypothetical protein [Pseudomonas sp. GX19020]